MMKCEWILCPVCGSKTRNKIRKDTVLEMSVILNTLVVTDQQKCAEQIFEKCRDNSFHSVRFSYDIQIPHALSVTVYKNQKDAESGNSAFSFSYQQENQIDGSYNIVDNPEKFTLEME